MRLVGLVRRLAAVARRRFGSSRSRHAQRASADTGPIPSSDPGWSWRSPATILAILALILTGLAILPELGADRGRQGQDAESTPASWLYDPGSRLGYPRKDSDFVPNLQIAAVDAYKGQGFQGDGAKGDAEDKEHGTVVDISLENRGPQPALITELEISVVERRMWTQCSMLVPSIEYEVRLPFGGEETEVSEDVRFEIPEHDFARFTIAVGPERQPCSPVEWFAVVDVYLIMSTGERLDAGRFSLIGGRSVDLDGPIGADEGLTLGCDWKLATDASYLRNYEESHGEYDFECHRLVARRIDWLMDIDGSVAQREIIELDDAMASVGF